MTLDEHIKRAEEDAKQAEFDTEWGIGDYFIDRTEALEHAKECRQLAEWLRELKEYRKVRRILSQNRILTDRYGEVVMWDDIKRVFKEVNADEDKEQSS